MKANKGAKSLRRVYASSYRVGIKNVQLVAWTWQTVTKQVVPFFLLGRQNNTGTPPLLRRTATATVTIVACNDYDNIYIDYWYEYKYEYMSI